MEITWRYDPRDTFVEPAPTGWADAAALLVEGNAAFAAVGADPGSGQQLVIPVTPEDLGLGAEAGSAPRQAPFAAVLGCADARVPLELLTSQSANDLFVVRVAGNVLGGECVGSLDYAVAHLAELRLLAVVGHTGCGAVAAAVDGYLDPGSYLPLVHSFPLRGIVDALMACVRGADRALHEAHGVDVSHRAGYRAALIDTAVVVNAAVAAEGLRRTFADRLSPAQGVAFGVYDLGSRRIGLPGTGAEAWSGGLLEPPRDGTLGAFVGEVARSPYVVSMLDAAPGEAH